MVDVYQQIYETGKAREPVYEAPGEHVGEGMSKIIQGGKGIQAEEHGDDVTEPAQPGMASESAELLREGKGEVHEGAACHGEAKRPDGGEEVGGIEVEEGAGSDAGGGGEDGEGAASGFGAAHAEDP